jgi:hypothetical protein
MRMATAFSSEALERLRLVTVFPSDTLERLRLATILPSDTLERLRMATTFSSEALERFRVTLPTMLDQAVTTARFASTLALPGALEAHRTSVDHFALKMLQVQATPWWNESEHLAAFGRISAFSEMLAASSRVKREFESASRAITDMATPTLATLADYRSFLDVAGLSLPRWPRVRLLTAAEKRKRFKVRLRSNAESSYVRSAKSMVHRYELVLREIIDWTMSSAFGDDWAEQRLPLCNCNDLLGKWRRRGGEVLSHADYFHYAQIMSHPEHFEGVFAAGFDDPDTLRNLLSAAGRLRAASHHAHDFKFEDLRDLRITWRTIEAGLIALTPEHTVEY